jgi:hypothetical protein
MSECRSRRDGDDAKAKGKSVDEAQKLHYEYVISAAL